MEPIDPKQDGVQEQIFTKRSEEITDNTVPFQAIPGGKTDSATAEPFPDFIFDGDMDISAPEWLVRDLFPKTGLAFIGGQSQAGKTFISLEIAKCLAEGLPFFGHTVKERVGVAILAGEGEGQMPNRIASMKQYGDIQGNLPIAFLGDIPDLKIEQMRNGLIAKLNGVDAIYRERFGIRLGVVIYDTLAATFDLNDENDNSEASKITKILRSVGRASNTLSMPVHHYGGTLQSGLRGATAWKGNCDTILSVLAEIDPVSGDVAKRELAIAKSREGKTGGISPFELPFVQLGTDEDGHAFGSLAVNPLLDAAPTLNRANKPKKVTRSVDAFNKAFNDAMASHAQDFKISGGPTVRAVKVEHMREPFSAHYASASETEEQSKEAKRKAFTRALNSMAAEYPTETRSQVEWIWSARTDYPDTPDKADMS